jgi:hypothetical protein
MGNHILRLMRIKSRNVFVLIFSFGSFMTVVSGGRETADGNVTSKPKLVLHGNGNFQTGE